MAKEIITLHGGEVLFKSELGKLDLEASDFRFHCSILCWDVFFFLQYCMICNYIDLYALYGYIRLVT